jgi:hypothetical protein
VVDDCDFQYVGFHGVPFTWDNGQQGDANVKVRLNRVLMDPAMMDIYAGTIV